MTYAVALPNPAVGSLESYIQGVRALPVLTVEQEQDFARRLRDSGDLDAARTLVMSHLRVVVHIARGYQGYGLPQADLIQEGNVGLMKAVRRFDPDRGVRLVSFAVHWIKAEMHEFILRNWRMVKIATTKAQRKLFFNLRSMKAQLGTLGPEEVQKIAQDLGVKPEEVREMETRLDGGDVALEPAGDDDEHSFGPIAYLADPHAEPIDKLVSAESEYLREEGLSQALAALDERSRRIIQARWLQEDDSRTLHELAAEYGVSAERIRQIEAKAMQKMKATMAELA